MDSNAIAELLNYETGNSFSESAYRKEFASFNRGRLYERQKLYKGVVTRILSIADLHVPFQKPIQTFTEYVDRVDILQINGDVLDCQALSKFIKTYRQSTIEEMVLARQYIIDLIEFIHPKKVVITYGNHDLRLQTYLAKNIDCDLLELMPKTPLELIFCDGFNHYDKKNHTKTWYEPLNKVMDDVEIDYTDNWYCQIGDAVFCHPFTFKGGILKTGEAAVRYFQNENIGHFAVAIVGHTHRVGNFFLGNILLYEQGACCYTEKMVYNDGNLTLPQKQGFIYLCQDKDGNTLRDTIELKQLN